MKYCRIGTLVGCLALFIFGFSVQPSSATESTITLPLNTTAYKFSIANDGIYQLTAADLMAAGIDLSHVNPNELTLMNRGAALPFVWHGNENDQFEADELLQFYAWSFNGTREEKLHVNDNVFWLLLDGAASDRVDVLAPTDDSTTITTFDERLVTAPDLIFTTGYLEWKNSFANGPDAWYWERMKQKSGQPPTVTDFTVDLPHLTTGSDGFISAEITAPSVAYHQLSLTVNDHPHTITLDEIFIDKANFNVDGLLPTDSLAAGTNTVSIQLNTESAYDATYYLNEIIVEYERDLVATDNFLQFGHNEAVSGLYEIRGISAESSSDLLLWNIFDDRQPIQISLSAENLIEAGDGTKTLQVGLSHSGASRYLLQSSSAPLSPTLTAVEVTNTQPEIGATWVAITHPDFTTEANRLADYRAIHSGFSTHVVTVDQIINQFGDGLATPFAINNYLVDAYENWQIQPEYVVLIGDSTINPRLLPCATCNSDVTSAPVYMPTHLEFVDRSQGMLPSDYPFTLLDGDAYPDIAIGRFAVQTTAEAAAIVDKIMTYESNLVSAETWQNQMLFLADAADGGGDYCGSLATTANTHFSKFENQITCLPNGANELDEQNLNNSAFEAINSGVSFVEYRGHGRIELWEAGIHRDDVGKFDNADKPVVIISTDCLDGNFAWFDNESISETFHGAANGGSVAHWSTSGLGYLFEYTYLNDQFHKALFEEGHTRIGDAINFAKVAFEDHGYHDTVLYSAILQGDPAMPLMETNLELTSKVLGSPVIEPNEEITFEITVENKGLYPSEVSVTNFLPEQLSYVSDSLRSANQSEEQRSVVFSEKLAFGESATWVITAQAGSNYAEVVNVALADGSGNLVGEKESYLDIFIANATTVEMGQVSAETQTHSHPIAILFGGMVLFSGMIIRQRRVSLVPLRLR